MKRIALAIVFACCTLVLSAQETIRVNYQGSKPTIIDFVTSFVNSRDHALNDEDGCMDESFNALRQAWLRHKQGKKQEDGVTVTVDQRNGYVVYEYKSVYDSEEELVKIEMCYWNESDGKHKLFAHNVACFRNGQYSGGQYDGLTFYRYNNETKKMTMSDDMGFDVVYGTADGAMVSYALPRYGKDIIVSYWKDSGKKQKTLKWNGRRFGF